MNQSLLVLILAVLAGWAEGFLRRHQGAGEVVGRRIKKEWDAIEDDIFRRHHLGKSIPVPHVEKESSHKQPQEIRAMFNIE